jgi:hypothetical protein
MKRTHTTQKNHLIFKLKNYETQFAQWRSKAWHKTKVCFDAVGGIFPFYWSRINNYVKWFNQNATAMKNPLVYEQIQTIKKERESVANALKSIHRHMKMKRIKLSQSNKSIYAPNSHKDISFNSNLISNFGTGQ